MAENWSEEELRAAVAAYIDMHTKQTNGVAFIKKSYYKELANKFEKRTIKSFEYRMQNISYIYSLLGREWIEGLKPAKNVGAKNAAIIEKLIFDVEGQSFPRSAEYETEVASYRSKKTKNAPTGIKEPAQSYVSVTQYTRDPQVKAWILDNANGVCESCRISAPFLNPNGQPFLEIHHLRRLADGGSDTISNTVALCPNCHRELHYGINSNSVKKVLYDKIKRLDQE